MRIMKRLVWILALVMLLTVTAFAEEDEDFAPMPEDAGAYAGLWKCEDTTAELTWEEEGFRVLIHKDLEDGTAMEWEYSCFYNEDGHSLDAMPTGTCLFLADGDPENSSSVAERYEDGEAVFTLDAEGCLLWQDKKEDAGKDLRFIKTGDPRLEGTWVCGRASMDIVFEEEGYRVFISWSSSAAEVTEWEYSCLYDAGRQALVSLPFGICTDVVYNEDGDIASATVRYEDGEAAFVLDSDGHLLWQDEKEDAGKDMTFEWVPILDMGA